jgi:FkbM family methyltransferase
MTGLARRLRGGVKTLAERALGVRIARGPASPPGKHADQAIRQLRHWSPGDVVFDVGANDGRTVLRLQEVLGGPRFHAFEPVEATYQTLVRRTSHLPNVTSHHLALGAHPGRQAIYLNQMHALNSFARGWTDEPIGDEEVEIDTVDRVMAALSVDFIHLLKVDTEGFELEVLKGAERALETGRIALVQLEVGLDQIPKPMLALEVARVHLAAHGYYLHGIYNQCHTRAAVPDGWRAADLEGYRPDVLAYCDALFVRAVLS